MHFFVAFTVLYACAILYLKSTCWRDPTSIFFQNERAHTPGYSAERLSQADSYVDETLLAPPVRWNPARRPAICVGVASVQRDGISYLKSTIGSLQEGLSREERESLYFVTLLAHTDQAQHQDYAQPWLLETIDRLPTYYDSQDRLRDATALELSLSHDLKAKFDYSILLEECARVNPLYTMIVEDDVVTLDGWLHRALEALETASTLTAEMGHTSFLYLRLFYYEALHGWNSESWQLYTRNCIAVVVVEMALITFVRKHYGSSRKPSVGLGTIILIPLYTLMCIGLFFAAGKNCVLPRPAGVSLMQEFGCCGQGLVFPQDQVVSDLLPAFREHRNSTLATDSFIEDYADKHDKLRWAITPVLLQHIGGKSSHGSPRSHFGSLTADWLFNFGFETNDVEALSQEHRAVVADQQQL